MNLFKLTLKINSGDLSKGDYYITAKTKESATNIWNKTYPNNKKNYCAFVLVKKNVDSIQGIKYQKN